MNILNYVGRNGFAGRCRVDIHKAAGSGKTTVIMTELEDNNGPSVTNAVEVIAEKIHNEVLGSIPLCRIEWIEHYPERGRGEFKETFDAVTFAEGFSSPTWKHIPEGEYDGLREMMR